jgi:tRNA/rRNA methyltransferase
LQSNSQLDHPSFEQVDVVLVAPRNPLNIGTAARAMANFGFSNLTVVAPYEPHWREAKSAIGAEALLQSAKRTECLKEAIANCTLVLGTASLTARQPEQPVVALPDLVPLIREELARGKERTAARIALVFGPEKRGLTREDLALCHRLLTIPTDSVQPSINLGQAVAVCLYELKSRLAASAQESRTSIEPSATSARLDQLAAVIDETMRAADYSPAVMRAANRHDTTLLLRRLTINDPDARRILGLFRRILWRLKR